MNKLTYINKYTNRHNENSIWQLCESWFLQLFYEHCFIFVLTYEMLVVPFLYYQAYFIIFYSAKNPGRNWLNFAHNNSRTNKINALELPELSLSFWTGVFVSYFHDSQSILVTLSLSNTFYHSYAYPFIHLFYFYLEFKRIKLDNDFLSVVDLFYTSGRPEAEIRP